MKLRGRTKTGVGLVLGILAGLGLVVIPGILAPQTQTQTSRNGSNSTTASGFTAAHTSPPLQPKPGNQSSASTSTVGTISSVTTLIGLTVLPALCFGIVAKRWASKQIT